MSAVSMIAKPSGAERSFERMRMAGTLRFGRAVPDRHILALAASREQVAEA